MHERIPMLVLGLGNVLCSDDGAGIAALHALRRRYELGAGVFAVDGATLGLTLLPLVDSADDLILIDAVAADAPPGTLLRLDGDDVPAAVYERLSPHQIGVGDLLAGASLLGRYPKRVVLHGVVPASLDLHVGLTPPVARQIHTLVERVADEVRDRGYSIVARDASHAAWAGNDDRLARLFDV